MKFVTYAHENDPQGTRFMDIEGSNYPVWAVDIQPHQEPSYEEKLSVVLKNLPPEFADWVQSEAWDRGHAYGQEEVLGIARSLAHGLEQAFEKYTVRLRLTK